MSWLPDWITGFNRDNYEAGLDADRKNALLTEDLRSRGLISEKDAAASQGRYDESLAYNPDDAINAATKEGFNAGADNIRNFAGDTINTLIGTPLKLIPWQVWLAAGLYAAWHLGAFKGILKKR